MGGAVEGWSLEGVAGVLWWGGGHGGEFVGSSYARGLHFPSCTPGAVT